jgi:hypothetical protein
MISAGVLAMCCLGRWSPNEIGSRIAPSNFLRFRRDSGLPENTKQIPVIEAMQTRYARHEFFLS